MRTFYQSLLPQHGLSRFAGWMAHCQQPWIKNRLIQGFIHYYQVDMTLALEENPNHYSNFNAFFTRALKSEKRPIAINPTAVVSPVDGTISQIGDIHANQLIQAKKINYSLPALLGGSTELASSFQRGKFATFYLSPKDYHRVHIPYTGKLQEMIYIPGQLFSVNTKTTAHLPNLFVRNERVITLFTTDIGLMAIILVGAMLVASISTVWEGIITPAPKRHIRHWHYNDSEVLLEKGQELGHFQLGSTVIILFTPDRICWTPEATTKKNIQFGQCIGHIL